MFTKKTKINKRINYFSVPLQREWEEGGHTEEMSSENTHKKYHKDFYYLSIESWGFLETESNFLKRFCQELNKLAIAVSDLRKTYSGSCFYFWREWMIKKWLCKIKCWIINFLD